MYHCPRCKCDYSWPAPRIYKVKGSKWFGKKLCDGCAILARPSNKRLQPIGNSHDTASKDRKMARRIK